MPSSRIITDAVPILQEVWAYAKPEWDRRYPNGPKLILSEVFRPAEVQRAYYARGRKPLAVVNALYKAAGLPAITDEENRHIITKSAPGTSRHEHYPSQAFDVAFVQGGKMIWADINFNRFANIVREKFGTRVVWGADWDGDGRSDDEKFIDRPHFQSK